MLAEPRLVDPADGAVGEHVEERGATAPAALLGLRGSGRPSASCGLRDVGDVVRDGDRRHVLALLRLAERSRPDGVVVVHAPNGVAPERWTRCSCTPVVVADEDEAVAALERARQRLQADVEVPPSPAKTTNVKSSSAGPALAERAVRVSTPLAMAAEFSNATCSHGTFHAVVGKRVVATSRQPVAVIDDLRRLDRVEHGAYDERDPAALAE